jgi:hypothetical protein
MRNPRPCACGHPGAEHGHQEASGPCWWGWSPDAKGCDCPAYRPAPRTEPLRAWRILQPIVQTVTEENLRDLAAWCGGIVVYNLGRPPYIEIPHLLDGTVVHIGDTIVRNGSSWEVEHAPPA